MGDAVDAIENLAEDICEDVAYAINEVGDFFGDGLDELENFFSDAGDLVDDVLTDPKAVIDSVKDVLFGSSTSCKAWNEHAWKWIAATGKIDTVTSPLLVFEYGQRCKRCRKIVGIQKCDPWRN